MYAQSNASILLCLSLAALFQQAYNILCLDALPENGLDVVIIVNVT